MNLDQEQIDALVARPSESLSVEIKAWFDPNSQEGELKIVRAALALRNWNGGFLVVGFVNSTWQPDEANCPIDVRSVFNVDKMQALVTKYASEVFEVGVGFSMRDGIEYPVIVVPPGFTAPVVVKRDLKKVGTNEDILKVNDFFVRTLNANGTPSTAKAGPLDLRMVMDLCFENRVADVGRFLRRHLTGTNVGELLAAIQQIPVTSAAQQRSLADRAFALLNDGERSRKQAIERRGADKEEAAIIALGSWSVALVLEPEHPDANCDRAFLNTIAAANPNYTGWPVWLDSSSFTDESSRPKWVEKTWQSLIISRQSWSDHIDFIRLDPRGEFYLWRILQDDLNPDRVQPRKVLDPILVTMRVSEAIAVGIVEARALGWREDAKLGFAFRWTGIDGRRLSPWANPLVSIGAIDEAHESAVQSFVEVPADTPLSAIAPYVGKATLELFLTFGGYSFPEAATEEWAKRLVERRLLF